MDYKNLTIILIIVFFQGIMYAQVMYYTTGGGGSQQQQEEYNYPKEPIWDYETNPLGIPQGQAENLPSIRVEDEQLKNKRKFYGGDGDKGHLGGFTEIDMHGISPYVWKNMISEYGIHSILDVGCGRGISTSWFLFHGVDILCVEGSHDAVQRTMLPDPNKQLIEHDFSRGPWWPSNTYDAIWAVEFLEHVSVHYHFNYITTFRKAALLFVTSSKWDGWHHVEVHDENWWIRKYELYGFKYDATLTEQVKSWANIEKSLPDDENGVNHNSPNGKRYNAQHIWLNMKVFVNPVVAALPRHAHLFPEIGCFGGRIPGGGIQHRICGSKPDSIETPLHPDYFPLNLTQEMDHEWVQHVKRHITVKE